MTLLEVAGLKKFYGDAVALRGADLQVAPGEVHGLVGENGAGKSTLVKILSGIVMPDAGAVTISGHALKFGSPKVTRLAGISTAFQELSLLPNLSVAENMLISELPSRAGIVSKRMVERRAAKILERWGVEDIDAGMLAGRLPLSAQQRLEIVRALQAEPHLLILDEPTAALPDTAWIFGHVRDVVARGASVLYISHKLAEIQDLCDRGSIMRNGAIVGSFTKEKFEHDKVISQMIGRSIEVAFPDRKHETHTSARIVLEASHIAVEPQLRDASLQLREGEILGVAGLEGQGQRQLFYALAGASHVSEGTITVDGKSVKLRSPRAALRAGVGIALVPEERKREGIFADLGSVPNISVPALRAVSKLGMLRRGAEYRTARDVGRANYLSDEFLAKNVGQLSGGNQQKTILARTALSGARVLLMFDPTRGIDPGAKLEVYRTLREAAADGVATLLYSTEIPELIGMCDRILVLYGGRVVAELTGDYMNEDAVMSAAVGHMGSPTATATDDNIVTQEAAR